MKMLMRQHDSMKKAEKKRLEKSSQGHGIAHCKKHHSEWLESMAWMGCVGWLPWPHVLKCLYIEVKGGQVTTAHHSGQSEFSNRKQEPRNQPYADPNEKPASHTQPSLLGSPKRVSKPGDPSLLQGAGK